AGADLLINDGPAVYTYDGAATADFDGHQVGGRPVLRGGAAWAGADVRGAIDAMTPGRAAAARDRLEGLLRQWCWTAATSPAVAAAFVAATFVQAVLRARPRVAVPGRSDSGKSTLVAEVLAPLFHGPNGFAVIDEDVTAAFVRDKVGHDSRPVVLDEFENSATRDAILALFRVATRNGRIGRSSPTGRTRETELPVLPWVLAIEPGDMATQDRNRQIDLSLGALPTNSPDPTLPPEGELHELRVELIAAAVWAVRKAEELARAIRRPAPDGADSRLVELLAVPAAFDAVLRHGRDVAPDVARATLESFVADHAREAPVPTERRLLDDILSRPVRVVYEGRGHERSVGEVVSGVLRSGTNADFKKDERRALELVGLRVIDTRFVRKGGGATLPAGLFVSNRAGATLLKGSGWEGASLTTLLKRLPGAIEENQSVNRVSARGVLVPEDVLDLAIDDSTEVYVDAPAGGSGGADA
ncbi:hypothetical protein, partial [Alienimonas sp. DA493]|uniref:hypothetical protein n=1 Tax=Alienimonas sp. DA493 TaxID=3373605 RepID=UPI003754356E